MTAGLTDEEFAGRVGFVVKRTMVMASGPDGAMWRRDEADGLWYRYGGQELAHPDDVHPSRS